MAARWRPGPDHRSEATQRLVSGLTRGDDVFELAKAIADLHPKDKTFPGEVFISIAVDALDAAGVERDVPLLYEGLREKHLAVSRLHSRDNKKIQFAVLWRSRVDLCRSTAATWPARRHHPGGQSQPYRFAGTLCATRLRACPADVVSPWGERR